MKNKALYYFIAICAGIALLIACSKDGDMGNDSKNPSDGKGGSTARMTISGNYLYAVDYRSLKVVNISNPLNPVYIKTVNVGRDIETIYPFKNYLFIGSNTGMYIYSLANPENPVQMSQFTHVTSCDPVIADDSLAFVTLRTTEVCNRFEETRQIEVLDIVDITNPQLITTYRTDYPPYGLDMNQNYLFVCHGSEGFAIYKKSKVINNQSGAMVKHVTGITAYDAILFNSLLFIVGSSGFYIYDYSNLTNPVLLSSILAGN